MRPPFPRRRCVRAGVVPNARCAVDARALYPHSATMERTTRSGCEMAGAAAPASLAGGTRMRWLARKQTGKLAILVAGLTLLLSGSAAAATGLHWSVAQIDQQESVDAGSIYSLSCPSVTLCVAGDDQGNILTSTHPGSGRKAWSTASVEAANAGLPWINGISCPSVELCIAVDQGGGVLASTNPTGGAKAWSRVAVSGSALVAIACPSASDCVAVGGAQAFSSAAPVGGASAWLAQTIDAQNRLTSVSCPTISFCAAVDDGGNVLTAPGPAGPWTSAHLTSRALLAISCGSGTLCAATDDDGSVWTSTTPTAGSSAWQRTSVSPGGGTRGVGCIGAAFCVTGNLGLPYSLDPGTTPATWVDGAPGRIIEADVISCPSLGLCVAASGGSVTVTTSPATGAWTSAAQIDGAPTFFGVSCPTVRRCYAGDDSGHTFVSSRPAAGPSTWMLAGGVSTTSSGFYGLACPTISFCVSARDDAPIGSSGSGGSGAFTKNPTGPASGWTPIALLRGTDPPVHGFFNAGCAGSGLCAITWDSGDLSISTTPSKPGSWKRIGHRGRHPGVYCPRTGRCVAPGGSCPTRSFCAVLSTVGDGTGSGIVSVSTDPVRGARGHWKSLRIDTGRRLTAISCPSTHQCFAVDTAGRILDSSRPAVASAWRVVKTVKQSLEALSCPSSSLCVAVGQNGIAVTGSR